MRTSVSSWIFGRQRIEEVFATLCEIGFNCIELTGEPRDYSSEILLQLSEKYKINIASIAGIYPWPTTERDLSCTDNQSRERAINYLRECCDFANKVNADIIIVSPTPVGKVQPFQGILTEMEWNKSISQAWDFSVSSLKAAGEYAQSINVTLAIEPLNRYETFLINNSEKAIEFIKDVGLDSVKLHLDTFHMNIEEADMQQAIISAKDYLVNIHIADSNRQAVGMGHTDFKTIIRTLSDIEYNGPLTLEPLPPISNPYYATEFVSYKHLFIEYLRHSLAEINRIEKSIFYHDEAS